MQGKAYIIKDREQTLRQASEIRYLKCREKKSKENR
jgi:hypothetical protein